VPASIWAQYTQIGDSVLINYNLANKPTLFIGLEKDNNVPVAIEYERFKKEITIPATFAKFPDLIHYMNPFNNKQASPEIAVKIALWLESQGITGIAKPTRFSSKLSVLQDVNRIQLSVANDQLISAELIDITGKHLQQVKGEELAFVTTKLKSGIYFVIATGKNGQYFAKIWIA
jgi:hypothetical protein